MNDVLRVCVMQSITILFILILGNPNLHAADYHISADAVNVINIDGKTPAYKDVTGGDRFILEAGDYRRIRFVDIYGKDGEPVTIINEGGQCIFGKNVVGKYAGISFDSCSYIHITGTGEAGTTYGFVVEGRKDEGIEYPHLGIGVGTGTTHFEADHIEIRNLTGIGVLAKTLASYGTDGTDGFNRNTLTQENTLLHDMYVHDIGYEGFYVGSSFFLSGEKVSKDGTDYYIHPPNLKGVQVYNNKIDNTGWSALAVKCAFEDGSSGLENAIYGNEITNYAYKETSGHDNAIQVGGGSKVDVFENYIHTGGGSGIDFHGHEGTIYNNLIVDPGPNRGDVAKKSGIWLECKDDISGHNINVYNNTIVNPSSFGIRSSDTTVDGHIVQNNIIVNPGWADESFHSPAVALADAAVNFVYSSSRSKATYDNNYYTADISEVKFINEASGDYTITDQSPAFEMGVDVGVTADFYGNTMTSPFHMGAYSNLDENGQLKSATATTGDNDYYWVGGTGNWSDYQNHWATTSGGTTFHDQIPTLQDNVHFDDNSFTAPGQVVTMDNCLVYANNFDWSGLTNTTYMPTLTSNSPEKIDIRGNFTLSEHMAYNVTDAIDFSGESGTLNLTTKGQTLYEINIESGATYSCQDDLTLKNGATFSNGGLKVNDNKLQLEHPTDGSDGFWAPYHIQGDETFTLDISNADVVLKNRAHLRLYHSNTNTLVKLVSDRNTNITLDDGYISYHQQYTFANSFIIGELLFEGNARSIFYGAVNAQTITVKDWAQVSGWHIVENLNILEGATLNSTTVDFILSDASTLNLESGMNSDFTELNGSNGIMRFRFTGTIPSFSWEYLNLENVEFRNYYNNSQDDYAQVFDPVKFTANNSIDNGGNFNIAINSPASRKLYWIGDGGDINDPTHWSETSGGPAVSFPPLPVDKVIFDANSFSTTGQVVNLTEDFQCKGMDWSAVSNSPTLGTGDYIVNSSASVSFSPSMAVSLNRITLTDAEDGQITTNGLDIGTSVYLESGKWSLQDDFKAQRIYVGDVVFNTNDYNLNLEYFMFYTGWAEVDFGTSVVTASLDIRYNDARFDFPRIKAENAEFIAGRMFNLGNKDHSHYFNKITAKSIGLGRSHANEVHFHNGTDVVIGGPIDTLSLGADIEMHMATGAAADGQIILTNPVGGPSGASYEYSFDGADTWTTESSKTDCGTGSYKIWMRLAGIESSATNIQNYYMYTRPDLYNHVDISYTLPSDAKTADGSIVISNVSFPDGTTEFEYSINNGLTWTSNASQLNLRAGIYKVQIRDKNNPEKVWKYYEISLENGINYGSVDALYLSAGVQHTINNRIHFDHMVEVGTPSPSAMIGIKGGVLKKTGAGDVERDYLRLEATTADISEGKTYTANNSANMGGVKNWIIDELPARTLYWVGANGGDMMDPAMWSLSSGGLPLTDPAEPASAIPPTPVDSLVFDTNSCSNGTVASKAKIYFSSDMACANFDASEMTTGYFYNWPIYTLTCTGSFIMNSTTQIYTPNRMPHMKFVGDKDRVFDVGIGVYAENVATVCLEVKMDKDAVLDITSSFGTYQSTYTSGTINFNCDSICAALSTVIGSQAYSGELTINLNDVVITHNQNYSPYFVINADHCDFNSEDATIIFNGATAENHDGWMYSLGDWKTASYPTLKLKNMIFKSTTEQDFISKRLFGKWEIEKLVVHGPSFALNGEGDVKIGNATFHDNAEIYGDNEFGNLTFTPNKVYRLEAGKTQTITNAWYGSGDGANLIEVSSTESGIRALVSMAAGCVALDRIQLRDMEGVGGADFYLGPNSTDLGNNVGFEWEYGDPLATPVIAGYGGHVSSEVKELELTIEGSYVPEQVKEINWEVPALFPVLEGSTTAGAGTPTIKLDLNAAVTGNKIKCQVNNSTAPCYGPSEWAEIELTFFDPRQNIRINTAAAAPQPAGEAFYLTIEVLESLGEVDYTFDGYTCNVTVSGLSAAPDGSYGRYSTDDGGSNFTNITESSVTIPGVVFTQGVGSFLLALNKAATFSSIEIMVDNTDDNKEIVANTATPAAVTVSNAIADAVVIDTDPVGAAEDGGGLLTVAPAMHLLDAFDNPATEGTYTVTAIKHDGGDWRLEGTATATSSIGNVTFSSIESYNNTYTDITNAQLRFEVAGGSRPATSAGFTIKKILAAQTVEAVAASTTPVAGATNTVSITVKDGNGNVDTSFDGDKTVSINGISAAPDGSFGTFNGVAITSQPQDVSINFVDGLASPSLVLHKAAVAQTITLSVATVVNPDASLGGITPGYGSATQLIMLTQPVGASTWSGGDLATQPKVAITDDYENILPAATDEIVVTTKTTPAGDNSHLTLNGATIQNAVNGAITYTDLNVTSDHTADITAQLIFTSGALSVSSADFTVRGVGVPTIAITADPATKLLDCQNTEVELDASASTNADGASTDLAFEWTTSDGNITTASNIAVIEVDVAGTYSLKLTDTRYGCTFATEDVVVTADQNAPSAVIAVVPDPELRCNNTPLILNSSGSTADAGHTFSRQWRKDGSDISGQTGATLSVTETGSYTLFITDNVNGCTHESATILITEDKSPPTAAITTGEGTLISCANESLTLGGGSSTDKDGGNNISYHWSTTAATGVANPASASIEATEAGTYTLQVSDNYTGCTDETQVVISGECNGIELDLKVLLQGSYDATLGEMKTDLNTKDIIPLIQPYNTAPWNYGGAETVASVPNANVVDWVLVELRETSGDVETADAASIVAKQAAFLLKDGSVVSTDGVSKVFFQVEITNKLYVVVRHRNHLAVQSSQALVKNGSGVYEYDFTDNTGKVCGADLAMRELKTGVYGLVAGDANSSGAVKNDDITGEMNPNLLQEGYHNSDLNMDGAVKNDDVSQISYLNLGKETFEK